MSILNDRKIAKLCNTPTHVLFNQLGEFVDYLSEPYYPSDLLAVRVWNERQEHIPVNRYHAVPIVSDQEFRDWKPMITPFKPELVRSNEHGQKLISSGISSMGYDVSLSDKELKLFTNVFNAEIDPMEIDTEKCFVTPEVHVCEKKGLPFIRIPPNSYLLGHTEEYFNIPRDILVVCLGKSTYARAGVAVNVTPIEPGFEGNVVIEIANHTNLPCRVYLNCGIAQFIFLQGEECGVSYADRGGKYQGQTGLTHARV